MKKTFLKIVSSLLCTAMTCGFIVPIDRVFADEETIPTLTVDVSQKKNEIMHGATGFLYGISNEGAPSVNTLTAIKPKVLSTKGALGTEHPYGDALDVADEFFEGGGEMVMMYCNGYYGKFGTDAEAADYAQVLADMIVPETVSYKESVRDKYPDIDSRLVYIPINEGTPRIIGGVREDTIFNSWKMYYDAIKSADPNASVAGPNNATYWSGYAVMEDFLVFCRDNDCLPDVITWHQLGDSGINNGVVTNSEHYRSLCTKLGIEEKPVVVNEYAWYSDCGNPGKLINWIAKFEEAQVYGCLPFWHQANNLNDLTTGQNEGTSAWWAYKWYADMSGNRLDVAQTNAELPGFYALASEEQNKNRISVLAGGADGNGKIVIKNLDKSDVFADSDRIKVEAEAVYFKGINKAEYKPDTILEGIYEIKDGKAEIVIENMHSSAAYNISVTKTNEKATSPLKGTWFGVYEAENAGFSNGLYTQASADAYPYYYYSGGYRVGEFSNTDDFLQYVIDVPLDGRYRLEFVYCNGIGSQSGNMDGHEPKNVSQKVIIDGENEQTIKLSNTLSENSSDCAEMYINLTAGKHTVKIMNDGAQSVYYPDKPIDIKLYHDVMYVKYIGAYDTEIEINDKYEAENADFNILGKVDKSDIIIDRKTDGYSGSGYVTGFGVSKTENGGGIRWSVNVPESGLYNISFKYASDTDGVINIYRDNTSITLDNFAASANVRNTNGEWQKTGKAIYLAKGVNVIDVDASDEILLDYMRVTKNHSDVSVEVKAVEGAGSFETGYSYYADSSYVKSIPAESDGQLREEKGAYLEITANVPETGKYYMQVFHSNNDLGGLHAISYKLLDRYASIQINGGAEKRYFFANTYSDDSFEETTVPVELEAGENSIRFYNDDSQKQFYCLNGNEYKHLPADIPVENYMPNFEKFIITPSEAEIDENADKYNINIMTTDGGYVFADKMCVSEGESVTFTAVSDRDAISTLTSLKINGKSVDTANGAVTVTDVAEDINVAAEFDYTYKEKINLDDYAKVSCRAYGNTDTAETLYNPPSKAADDDLATYYDGYGGAKLNLNFPMYVYIKGVRLTVAEGNLNSLDGAVLAVSADGENWTPIYTVSGGIVPYPSSNEITVSDMSDTARKLLNENAYKYIRIELLNGAKISDFSVYGEYNGETIEIDLSDKVCEGSASYDEENQNYTKVFDGDITTYFNGKKGGYCQVDLGEKANVTRVGIYQANLGKIRLENDVVYASDDGSAWKEIGTVGSYALDEWVYVDVKANCRYIKLASTNGSVLPVAEIKIWKLDESTFEYDVEQNTFGVKFITTPYSKITVNGGVYYSGADGEADIKFGVSGIEKYQIEYKIEKGGYKTVSGTEDIASSEILKIQAPLTLKNGIYYSEDFNSVASGVLSRTIGYRQTDTQMFNMYAPYDSFDVKADNVKLSITNTAKNYRQISFPINENLSDKKISMDVKFPDNGDAEFCIRDSENQVIAAVHHASDGVTTFGATGNAFTAGNKSIGTQKTAVGDVQGGTSVNITITADTSNGVITAKIGDVTVIENNFSKAKAADDAQSSIYIGISSGATLNIDNIMVTSLDYEENAQSPSKTEFGTITYENNQVRIPVSVAQNDELNLNIYVAEYDGTGNLIGIKAVKKILSETEDIYIDYKMQSEENSTAVFVWDNNMIPYCVKFYK